MAGEPLSDLLEFAVDLAEKAGEITLNYFQGRFSVETKADASPVTDADEAAERLIVAGLQSLAPEIPIVAEESPWPDREKYPKQFDIDELRCIYCGMCEEACPCDAIELTPHYEITGLTRQEMIFDREKLLEVYDRTIEQKPM